MTGFAAKGIQGSSIFSLNTINENRGVSFAGGGDDGICTIPNMIGRYNPHILGPSRGDHIVEYCGDHPELDNLNAAQSGALAKNLDHQLDYLLPAIKSYPGIDLDNDWKLINVLIGYVDSCDSCVLDIYSGNNTELYESYVDKALERIRASIPRVLVNLIGISNVGDIISRTANQKYCQPFPFTSVQVNRYLCLCTHHDDYHQGLASVVEQINDKLHGLSEKYNALNDESFAVMYSPSPVNFSSFPLEAISQLIRAFLSDIDCFHPSTKGHEWSARATWKGMFLPKDERPNVLNWDDIDMDQVYCPTELDRFQV
ncbi:hypothetical protein DFQ28_000667 [Apophysomyces sp. BC1034]|nr:hypothetical protein DFQ28_000667 [Apophysomyces sp. BC1034]